MKLEVNPEFGPECQPWPKDCGQIRQRGGKKPKFGFWNRGIGWSIGESEQMLFNQRFAGKMMACVTCQSLIITQSMNEWKVSHENIFNFQFLSVNLYPELNTKQTSIFPHQMKTVTSSHSQTIPDTPTTRSLVPIGHLRLQDSTLPKDYFFFYLASLSS